MGLLDDLLGQISGGDAAGDPRGARTAPRRGTGPGMGTVMAALLPVVLAMLRSQARTGAPGGGSAGGGALGDLLGQVLGGGAAGGGLGALLERFTRAGYDEQVRSWVGTGQNLPLPADALEKVFGPGGLAEIARRAGLSETDTARGLSQLVPEVVDRVTPEGRVPPAESLLASVDAMAKRLGA